ncbi:MAG: glycosyltransferase family 4 protein [Candidatus Pacebacteria bacterium]|nr:glycosyltransferase family 4 protein [Candidatus Paceibacterota bacterium]
MNIYYLTQQYGNFASGVGTYSTNLINAAAEQGHRVTVICPKEEKREFLGSGVRIIEVDRKKWDPSHGNWFTLSFQFLFVLKKAMKGERIDIIHFTDARECFFWKIIKKEANIPTIGTMHDYIFMEAEHNPFFYKKIYNDWLKRWLYYNFVSRVEMKSLNSLDCIIAVSDYIKKRLVVSYSIKAEKIEVIYNGISLNAKKDKMIGEKKNFILIIGNNLQGKGIITLFKAFVLIKNKYPNLKIKIIGRDINQKYLEKIAEEMGIIREVSFLGRQSNEYVLAEMKKAFAYIMPSEREGFGIVFLEAMSCGIPVVGGNVGGTKELIKDGKNGFLVKPRDFMDLASKISILYEDDELRDKIVKKGFETAQNYSIRKMIHKTMKIYLSFS